MMDSETQSLSPRLLVVDDDIVTRKVVVHGLRNAGFNEIHEAEDGLAVKEYLTGHTVDVVITDVMMPRLDGLELIRWARQRYPEIVWIILSSLDTFDTAVEAIHLGAFDFLAKPPNLKELEISLRNALAHRKLVEEKEALHRSLEERVLQLEGLCRILGDQAEQINQDLRRAEIIQSALLPQVPPAMRGLSVYSLYRPGHFVGGDLYDVIVVDENKIAIYVADASGHGVSAAMLSVLFKQRLPKILIPGAAINPAVVLAKINGELFRDVVAPGMFITAVYCLIDTGQATVDIASAGHPPVYLVRASGEASLMERTGPALGLHADAAFKEMHIDFRPGDRLFLYSDGLTDLADDAAEKQNVLVERLRATELTASSFLKDQLKLLSPVSARERDDITMVLVEFRDGPSNFDNGRKESDAQAKPVVPTSGSLHYGELDESTVINIRGRGTYMLSHNFFDAVQAIIDGKRGLTIDLSGCDYLDSTFLGMIHEVVAMGDKAGVPVHVQRISESIRSLFEELSMDLVLQHVHEPAESLPYMEPLVKAAPDEGNLHRRILRAHDVLVSLSDENRQKFQGVVEMLRKEMGDAAPPPIGGCSHP
ncbi:MAG: SpoIIE family protein phosphatase [Planctomycetes bacterium]|nr:SpoIIE family protein phosphatase [Planctomycetota bacterium]